MIKNKFFQYKNPNFSTEELKLYEYYKTRDPIELGIKVWDLMVTNTPIPKELQPFVAQAMLSLAKGYERAYRDNQIVLDMAFKVFEECMTIENAATEIAPKYNLEPDTIGRIYKDGKYSKDKTYLKNKIGWSNLKI